MQSLHIAQYSFRGGIQQYPIAKFVNMACIHLDILHLSYTLHQQQYRDQYVR